MPPLPATPEAECGDILIVDDTPENITVLRDILLHAGHRVRPAQRGALAVHAVESQCPDLVLLDIMMPEMDGYETCERIKAIPGAQDLPILFISALDGASDKLRAFREGGVDYVPKPFHAGEVLARVNVHLKLRFASRRLARQNAELEAAARLRDDVDAILRHDLKSPLATILAAAETISAIETEGVAATMSGHIRDAGWAMVEQIQRSLDLLKMERGVYVPKPVAVDLRAILGRLATELALTPAGRHASVSFHDAAAPGPWWIEGEPMLCRGLFRNLLKNALEASPEGAAVRVELAETREASTVTITNQGEIPAAIRGSLFQKFATAGKDGGTGLGAYSARLMAETQGGAVRLADAPAGSTAIAVTLPGAKAAEAMPPPPTPPVASGLAGLVLIADDDAAHAEAMARLLAISGVGTAVARNAAEAGELLARGDCAAALIDFEMPGGNGPVVARRHRAEGGRARLIALTAHDDAEIHAACLAAGFDRVLVKPVDRARLLAELAGESAPGFGETAAETIDPDLAPLVPAFLETRVKELASLRTALERKDVAEVRLLSHRLRGGFSIYGFTTAAAACAQLERAAGAGDAAAAGEHLATLTRTLERLRLQSAAPS